MLCVTCLGQDHDMPNCPNCRALGDRSSIERAKILLLWRNKFTSYPLSRRQFQENKPMYADVTCISDSYFRRYLEIASTSAADSDKDKSNHPTDPIDLISPSSGEDIVLQDIDKKDLQNLVPMECDPDPVTQEPQYKWYVQGT